MPKKPPMIVKKANSLIDAEFDLTLNESRLLLYCVAQIEPKKKIEPDQMFYIDAKSFAEAFELDIEGVYKTMKRSMNRLAERWVTIQTEEGERKEIRWIISKQYFARQGRIGLQFHYDMLPYISELTKRFTQYNLSYVRKMTSSYGIPMYELLTKRKDLVRQRFSLEFLRQKLCLDNKYAEWRDFRRNVIEPAIKDLNNDSGEFLASYEPVKEGREVVAVDISYHPREKPTVSKPQAKPGNKAKSQEHATEEAEWQKFGYRTPREYRDALVLRDKVEFNVESAVEYHRAFAKSLREKSDNEGS